jgi:hypothetical protein
MMAFNENPKGGFGFSVLSALVDFIQLNVRHLTIKAELVRQSPPHMSMNVRILPLLPGRTRTSPTSGRFSGSLPAQTRPSLSGPVLSFYTR